MHHRTNQVKKHAPAACVRQFVELGASVIRKSKRCESDERWLQLVFEKMRVTEMFRVPAEGKSHLVAQRYSRAVRNEALTPSDT